MESTMNKYKTQGEILEILKDVLRVQGIGEDEGDCTAQFLRDHFPNNVPVEIAIKALKEVNLGKELLENSALLYLSMVPTPGIEVEILARLNNYRSVTEQTKHTFNERYQLSKALMFLNHPEGEIEYNYLRTLMATYPKYGQPVPSHYFNEFDEELSQWRSNRAAGKRWEPAE